MIAECPWMKDMCDMYCQCCEEKPCDSAIMCMENSIEVRDGEGQ